MSQNMFCYQCQETAGCTGCTHSGVCGKTPQIAGLQGGQIIELLGMINLRILSFPLVLL